MERRGSYGGIGGDRFGRKEQTEKSKTQIKGG
jgi:hypothetical protein